MISTLYQKTMYTVPVDFVIHDMYEYDMTKANISILLQQNIINQEEFDRLASLPGKDRKIEVGLMQKHNPELIKVLDKGFQEARRNLVSSNSIQDNEIISIKKDALFVTRLLQNTRFGNISFVAKNRYNLMINIPSPIKMEIYYASNGKIDIKGINDSKLYLHQDYIDTIRELLSKVYFGDFAGAVQYISDFIVDYNERNLPVSFYREFNAGSGYKLNAIANSYYVIDNIDQSYINSIDIGYNQFFNRELFKIISKIYFTYVKKPKNI